MGEVLRTAICPHDSSKRWANWIDFLNYLKDKTQINFSVVPCTDFPCYYEKFKEIDFSYSNPLDALKLERERGFVTVAGNDNYDEMVLFTRKGESVDLTQLKGKSIGFVDNQFASFLGLYYLKRVGVTDLKVIHYDSWQAVISGVLKKEAHFGILYRDFYEQLNELSKSMINAFFFSETKLFSHYFMISPEKASLRERILGALTNLDERGRELAKKLRINTFYEVKDLSKVKELLSKVEGA